MVGFELSDEQKALQRLARDFAQRHVAPVAGEYDRSGEFPWHVIDQAYEIGLMNITVAEQYGGGGLGWFESALVAEQIAVACAGVMTTFAAHELALTPLELAASDAQKRKFTIPLIANRQLAAFCLTEPGAGSDVASLHTRAIKDGDNYIISGTKHFISNGNVASLYSVFAATEPEQKHRGISAFIVPRESAGLTPNHMGSKMGHRASDTAEIVFDEVRVPAAHRIGREGDGFRIAMQTFDRTRIGVGASGVGVAQAALDASVKFAKERQQFGQPVANFQAVQFMLADMAMRIETARLAVWHAAWLADQKLLSPASAAHASAIAKCYGADVAMACATDAVQIHGGYGYMQEFGVEKLMRDAKLLQIYEGTNQIQRVIIAKHLLKD